jgi:hypothetical protein
MAGEFVCTPARLTQTKTGFAKTLLDDVSIDLDLSAMVPDQTALRASVVDPHARLAYWHAGCSGEYLVTHLDTGNTDKFAIDPVAVGLPAGASLCLAEMVYDTDHARVLVLGGRVMPTMRSRVEVALELTAHGAWRKVYDFRADIGDDVGFLHPYQTIASFDADTDEVTVPLYRESTKEIKRLVWNADTFAIRYVPGGGGVQHQFFDAASGRTLYFSCDLPGFIASADEAAGPPLVTIDADSLAGAGIKDICYKGFLGAGFDPVSRREYMLVRADSDAPLTRLRVGTADIASDAWLGFVTTDLTYAQYFIGAPGTAGFVTVDFYPGKE